MTTVSRFSSGGATFPPSRASPDTEKRRPESQNTNGDCIKNTVFSKRSKKKGKKQKKEKNNKRRENEKRGKRKTENKKKKKEKKEKEKRRRKTNYIQNSRSPAPVAAVMLSSK